MLHTLFHFSLTVTWVSKRFPLENGTVIHTNMPYTHTRMTLQELRVPEVSDEAVAHVETSTKVAAARCGREAVWAAEKERRRCGD